MLKNPDNKTLTSNFENGRDVKMYHFNARQRFNRIFFIQAFIGMDSIFRICFLFLISGFRLWRPPAESGLKPISPVEPVDKELWLFNITADPYEKYDLSNVYPSVVDKMLNRLQGYWKSMVPPMFPKNDPDCDPSKHGGVWGPWR